jgi:hypothetical protein
MNPEMSLARCLFAGKNGSIYARTIELSNKFIDTASQILAVSFGGYQVDLGFGRELLIHIEKVTNHG